MLPTLKPTLKPTNFLDPVINQSNAVTVLIVNSDIRIGLPCMYFSTDRLIPQATDQVCENEKVYIILSFIDGKVVEVLKEIAGYCLVEAYILVMEKPSETSLHYLERNGIYKIWFVETSEISNFNGWPSSNRTFKVCYTVHVPYTTIDNHQSYGLESLIINQSGNFAHIKVEFIKHTQGCISGGFLGVFEHLKNRSCDVVIGAVMCNEMLPFIVSSPYFLEDGTVLVTPNVKCTRQLFNAPIVVASLWVFISLISVEISQIKLVKNTNIKLFVTAPLLLLTVVLFGYLQAQLYNLLVIDHHNCGVKSLVDIVEKKLITGIEPPLIQVFDILGVPKVDLKTLKQYLKPDSVVDLRIKLESDKCHVIRTILFKYLVPRYYLKENGVMKFRIVQTIHRRSYLLHVRKGYPYMKDLNLGIMKFQESGISKYLEKQVTGYMDLNYIIKRSTLLSYFTPVKIQEFYRLFVFVLIMWVISVLVLLLEIIVNK